MVHRHPEIQKRMDAALAFVRKQAAVEKLDADRVGVMALSAGGLWGLAPALRKEPPAWLRCAVAWYPLLGATGVPPGSLPLEGLKAVNGPKSPPLFVVRAGKDAPGLNGLLDEFVTKARGKGVPLTLEELPEGHHAFEWVDDVEGSREAMRKTALFFEEHLLR